MTGLSRKLLVAFFSVACVTTSVSAQLPRQYPPARLLTRAEIEARLQEVEAAAQARDSSDQAREHARDEAELLARRLREGDFKAGDRILLYVQSEEALSDTFAVNAAGAVVLPSLGEVSLSGVLRSELSDRMSREISRYLRAPEVRAEPLLRVTVTGSVATPGFHTVSPDMLLTDVIMRVAGHRCARD